MMMTSSEVIELLSSSSEEEDQGAGQERWIEWASDVVSISDSSSDSGGAESPAQSHHLKQSHLDPSTLPSLVHKVKQKGKHQLDNNAPCESPPPVRSRRRRRLDQPRSPSSPPPPREQAHSSTFESFTSSIPSSTESPRSHPVETALEPPRDRSLCIEEPASPTATPPPPPSDCLSQDPDVMFVQVVRVAHGMQCSDSDYTYLPPAFTIPREKPWPAEWAGRKVDVSAFREAYCVGQLHRDTVAQLCALRFVWDDELEALKWRVHLGALSTYKAIYGDVAIPPSFRISDAKPVDPRWSKDILRSELHLGAIAQTLRTCRDMLTDLQRDQLDHIGFEWDLAVVEWTTRVKALQVFKQVYGHLNVPAMFVVPNDDPAWPAPTFNVPLGWVVVSIRLNWRALPLDRTQVLQKLGFDHMPWRRDRVPKRQFGAAPKPLPVLAPAPLRPPLLFPLVVPLNPIQKPGTGIPKSLPVTSPRSPMPMTASSAPQPIPHRPAVTRYCNMDAETHYLGANATPRFPLFQTRALPPTVEWTDYGEVVRGDLEWTSNAASADDRMGYNSHPQHRR